ncbi:MAG: ABC transporter substrate-binding protein [Bacteroidales bacterium]|nr:ABC transporter substrate-binding protein [Bacteroidales bacterium]
MQGLFRRAFEILTALMLMMLIAASCALTPQPPLPEGEGGLQCGANLMRYAHNVAVYAVDSGYRVEVLNPWDTTVLLGDCFVPKEGFSSVISFSSTQWSVFIELDEIDRVKGILEGRNIHSPKMKQLLADGVVQDVGTESAKNMELMIQLHPDIILYSPYFDGNQDPLRVTGAILFPFADYLESTPLGRAEWIRVVGLLAGCPERADAWFDDIVRRYDELKGLCADVQQRPTVFSDLPFNGQWYVAGGKSYIAQLFTDAGADYLWKDDPSTASFPLDSETILAKAKHADFWRVANSSSLPMTYETLKRENSIYTLFDAFKNHKIFVCDIQESGYFETSQIEPDVLLADFIAVFHPEIITTDYQPKYYRMME